MTQHGVKMWYSRDQHGDQPLMVHTAAEMDAALDGLLAQPFENSVAACYSLDRPVNDAGMPDHELLIAVNAQDSVGSLCFTGDGGTWYPKGTTSRYEDHYYCYYGNDRDFPRDAELTLDQVRRAAHEFLTSGGQRPTTVDWSTTSRSSSS